MFGFWNADNYVDIYALSRINGYKRYRAASLGLARGDFTFLRCQLYVYRDFALRFSKIRLCVILVFIENIK